MTSKKGAMKKVVITGVSSGLGYGLAKELLGRGYKVFGSVRNEADAERVAAEMGKDFRPLLFDVTDSEAVFQAAQEVAAAVGEEGLSGLINNVGVAITGPLSDQPLEEVRVHFETNVIGLVCTTQTFLPLLGATTPQTQPPGRIIMSLAYISPFGFQSLYTCPP